MNLAHVLDNLIAQKRVPALIAISIASGAIRHSVLWLMNPSVMNAWSSLSTRRL